MKLIKQPLSFEVDEINIEPAPITARHSKLLPNTIRGLICGPSNCGKTNVMLNLLLHRNGLKFRNLYLYSKTAFQPKYCFLFNVLKQISEVQLFVFNDEKEVINPKEALPFSVMIFDDVICENQSNIRLFFTMGRHHNIDSFYLSQTYSKIPKQLVRDNANFLVIFQQDDINLRHIYHEHVNNDMSWQYFKDICSLVWKTPHSFLVINRDSPLNNGRYRKNLDTFIQL